MTAHISRLYILQVGALVLLVLQCPSTVTSALTSSVAAVGATSALRTNTTTPAPTTTVLTTSTPAPLPTTAAPVCRSVEAPVTCNCSFTYNVESNDGNYAIGDSVKYTCDHGFDMDGEELILCGYDGQWNGTAPECHPKDCKNVSVSDNVNVSYSNASTLYGSIITYSCATGYHSNENMVRDCGENGAWTGAEPVCRIKDCGTVQELPNGNVIYINGNTTYGSVLSYTCSLGYNLSANVTRTCQNDTKWSGSEPTCTIKDCGKVHDELLNGDVTYINGNTTYGSVLFYTCSPGYTLSANFTRKCQNDIKWSGSKPTCNIKDCGTVQELPNGNVIYINGNTTYGSVLSYTCSLGYNLSANVTRTCQNDTKWSGSEPTCTIKDCGKVHDELLNGDVTYINGNTTYGSVLFYTCSPGYTLSANFTRKCQNDIKWSGSKPTCNIKDCGTVQELPNGNVIYINGNTTYGSVLSYTCSLGYNLSANVTRTCQNDTKWSGSEPTCTIKACQDVATIQNGYFSYSLVGKEFRSTVTYACHSGYSLNGNTIRICSENAQWNGTKPTCKLIQHGLYEKCNISAPKEQCMLNHSFCIEDTNSGLYTCQCDWKHYYANDTHICEERPELGARDMGLFKEEYITSSISMQWSKAYNLSNGRTYTIRYHSNNANIKQIDQIQFERTAKLISHLSSGTRYQFQLFSSKNGILSGENETAYAYTFPESPTNGTFENINEKNLTIYWTIDTNRNCENYSIGIFPKPDSMVSAQVIVERENTQLHQSYTFQGLSGGTNYTVKLFSLVDSNSKKSSVPLTRETYTRPEVISEIREIGKHSNRIDLSLTGPETFTEGYIVIVSETGVTHNFLIDQNVTITDLEPGTNYTFNVFSFIKHLTSEYSVTWETMTKPESPGNMEIKEITEDSIAIEWTISDNYTFDNFVIIWGSDGGDLLPAETRNYTIPSLEYGTNYIISIQTVLFSVTSEETTQSTYTRPIPPNSAEITDQTDSTIGLNINNTEARYDYVVVFYAEMNDTFGNTSDVLLTGLDQGTEFTFEVHSMIGDVISLRSFQINGTTRPGSPPDANFPLESLHEKELTVNWEPVSQGGADIYQIELTGASENQIQPKNVTAPNTSVKFIDLEAGLWYTATISTIWNSLISTTNITLSIYTRPPAPKASSIGNIATTSMNVNISETEWDHYLFVVAPSPNNGNSTYIISKDNLPLSLTELDKGKQYHISVFSIVGGIQGESSYNVSSFTKPDKVDSTTIQQNVTATNSSVMGVTWNFTKKQGGVEFYSLSFKCRSPNDDGSIQNVNYENRTKVTSAVVENLDPGTFCSITITTHIGNQTGESVTKNISLSTDEEASGNFTISQFTTNANNLSISWDKPPDPNGIIRRYYVYVIDGKHNCVKHHTMFGCANCMEIASNPNCSSSLEMPKWCEVNEIRSLDYLKENINYNYTTVNNDLHPYRNYTVTITPYTKCFGATESRTELTKQSVPSGPPIDLTQSISESTYDTLKLSWNRPTEDEQNGIITRYTIYYSYIARTCFDDEGSEINTSLNVNASDIDVKNNTSITVKYAFGYYNVSVSAWTKVGEGPKTSSKLMRTNQTIPGEIRNSPLVNESSTTTFNLYWEPPCYVNGIIDHYRIRVMNVNTSTVVQNFTTNSNMTETSIQHLLPYHNYTVSVAAVNTMYPEGQAVNTTAISRTNTGAPHQPTNIRAEPLSANSLKVTWTTPDLYTGVTRYDITTKDSVSSKQKSTQSEWNFNLSEFVVVELEEFWNYTVTVTAITSAGNKTSPWSAQIRTLEAAPGVVTNLNLTTEQDATLPRSVDVTWKEPTNRDLNGILISYFVDFTCTSEDYVKTVIQSVNVSHTTYNLNDIKPSSCNISVYAATAAGNGTIVKQEITVPPGAPIKPQETHSDPLMKESTETSVKDETTQIAVGIPTDFLCDDRNGKPQQIGLIISAADKATDKPCIGDKTCFDKINTVYKNWFQVHTQDNPTPYITTPKDWNPCSSGSNAGRRRRSAKTAEPFNIGAQGECSGVDINLNCNGQLKPDTSYRVRSFACTEGGCSESEYSKPIKTTTSLPFLRTVTNLELPNCFIERNKDSETNQLVPIVAGVASAAVVLLIVIGAVIFLKRRQAACFDKSAEEGSTHSRTEPGAPGTEMTDQKRPSSKVFRHMPIQLSEFPESVDNMKKDSALIFSDAYKTLRETNAGHLMTIAESQNCRPKNRYTNILPFDHSRVKLLPLDGEDGSDYINASYIPGYTSRREYIATQGPMPATFDDFWRMVWEQNVEIVVMLTKLVEKGRNKCDKYWPNANEPQFYGDLSISVMSESNLSDYTIRIMEVKLNGEKRTVKQFSFLKWPDMGCPEYPELLLEFVKSVRQHESAQSKGMPLVVHCSAGVGRTGTFIAVDHLLQHIRDHDEVDIYALVAEMRNNRCNMVQTEDQYIYIHDCIKEFITSDEDEFDDDDDEHVYANSPNAQQENVYQNTAFSKQF